MSDAAEKPAVIPAPPAVVVPPIASPPPAPPARPARYPHDGGGTGALSQWQLIRRRFAQHKLAVFSFYLLILIYGVAVFAEFVAPYHKLDRNTDYAYAPPQLPRFSFAHGLHVYALQQHTDPVTLQKTYREDRARIVPLRFFAPGSPAALWGVLPIERRLLGVDRADYLANYGGAEAGAPEPTFHFLGADRLGHDILSRVIYGSRISLSIGVMAIVITFILGLSIGGVSGYFGGAIDTFIQRVIEIINSFPHLPLWLGIAAVMPPDWPALRVYFAITIVLSALNWTGLARVVRGKILALREEDYAVAARLLGAGHARIIFRHLLPGFTSHIIVVLTMSVPSMILGETALSFLGLGLRTPVVSWGVMLQDCNSLQAVSNYPWLLLPVVPIVLTVLCFNFFGDGLRDAADPYSSR